MSHYKNGTPAKVGDLVVGPVYNTKGPVAGTITSITPGMDACNCKVRFLALVPISEATDDHPAGLLDANVPGMAVRLVDGVLPPFERVKTVNHGTEGPEVAVIACEDDSACGELLRADEAFTLAKEHNERANRELDALTARALVEEAELVAKEPLFEKAYNETSARPVRSLSDEDLVQKAIPTHVEARPGSLIGDDLVEKKLVLEEPVELSAPSA